MTTRSRARIYRGVQRPVSQGACTSCGRVVPVTNGRRRTHRDQDGNVCVGSRVTVGGAEQPVDYDPDEALAMLHAPIDRWSSRDRSKPAAKWSGKAPAQSDTPTD